MLTRMPTLRLDDVPDWVIETFSQRAANLGMSLLDYVRLVLMRAAAEESDDDAARPIEEVMAEMATNEPSGLTVEELVALIRKTRDA
jgi:hypothetical protein